MLDTSEFERWREASELAGRGARVQAAAGVHNWACFLAEQAAQLAVKGVLHGMGTGPWGHDLVRLSDAVGEASGLAFPPEVVAAARRLSRHYIATRYPDAHASGAPGTHYGEEDSAHALADLEIVLRFVDQLWEKLRRADEDAHER